MESDKVDGIAEAIARITEIVEAEVHAGMCPICQAEMWHMEDCAYLALKEAYLALKEVELYAGLTEGDCDFILTSLESTRQAIEGYKYPTLKLRQKQLEQVGNVRHKIQELRRQQKDEYN